MDLSPQTDGQVSVHPAANSQHDNSNAALNESSGWAALVRNFGDRDKSA